MLAVRESKIRRASACLSLLAVVEIGLRTIGLVRRNDVEVNVGFKGCPETKGKLK